jgi:uncharacterized membrane protein
VSTYQIALLLHIFGAIVYFGGIIVAGVAFFSARGSERASEIAAVLGLARTGVLLAGLGAALLLGCGFWLINVSGTTGFDNGWISAALALFIGSVAIGGIAGQAPKKARKLAVRLAGSTDRRTPELDRLLADRPSLILNGLSMGASLAVLVLMVWQPGS